MFYYVKRFIHFLIIVLLALALILLIYLGIQDINASKAKKYLVDKYGYSEFKVFAYHVTEYIYERDETCKDSWFKKCTDDATLEKKIKFFTLDKDIIEVIQHEDGTFEDDIPKEEENND